MQELALKSSSGPGTRLAEFGEQAGAGSSKLEAGIAEVQRTLTWNALDVSFAPKESVTARCTTKLPA